MKKLSLDESAQIIISHVTEGVKIAEKAMLPKAIINFIRTHHEMVKRSTLQFAKNQS